MAECMMILGFAYVYLLTFVCTTSDFFNMSYDKDIPVRLIGKFFGNRNMIFSVFNVIFPSLTLSLCYRYDVIRFLKLD